MEWNEMQLIERARFELKWATKQVDSGKKSRICAYSPAHDIIEALWISANYLDASTECVATLQVLMDSASHQLFR